MSRPNVKTADTLRWSATALAVITGVVNFYYGNTNAGFYENLWYVMGGIYILASILLAGNVMPHFVQPTIFAYSLFLITLWAVAAMLVGAGLDSVAYVDKIIEAVLAVNLAMLVSKFRGNTSWR